MKKVGTITFHWATNYGAVIQAYALQMFLKQNGIETEIINYLPFQNIALRNIDWIRRRDFDAIKRERAIKRFREKNLTVSRHKYRSYKTLRSAADSYCAIVSGSDQVMNFSFLQYAERGKMTPSYYLSFAGEKTKKIAYAASFGTDRIPSTYADFVKEELDSFSWVSVREGSACTMLKDIGIESEIVVDPTMLVEREIYETLIDEEHVSRNGAFSYILHKNQVEAHRCESKIIKIFGEKKTVTGDYSVENWLRNIRSSSFIVTNSFHATVFALLFHTPFITVSVEGSKMDNRLLTLLNMVGLEDRFFKAYDESKINTLLQKNVNWEDVDKRMCVAREHSQRKLLNVLNYQIDNGVWRHDG